jgi:fibronectin-binding autotransporter adhesin
MKTKSPLIRFDRLLIAALALLAAPAAQAQLYTGTNSTGFWNTSRWSSSDTGPFNSSWTANSASLFKAGTGTYTFTGANSSGAVSVGNITLEDNVTVNFSGASGTLSGGGVVRTISVGSGSTLDFGSQGFTTGGQGWIKTGSGVLALAGGAFTNGFTLDGGVVVMRGVDAMGAGSGNILTLSNGTVATSANRALTTAKYGGGIRIRGNITFGALTNVTTLSSATANISFANNVDLGGSTRTLTIGGNGNYEFSGVMSNGGLTVAAAAGATGNLTLSGANTYTGKTTINSGTVVLSGSGTAGATNSDLEVAGGLLNLSAGTKTNAAFTLSGGTITNGTLQATSYALQGGTIISNATLGTGTATVTTGTTTLNGLLNATTVNVNSGALNLGAADRLANGAAVTIAGGTLGMGANNDTVGAFTISSGTLGGSGTLTAASYSLQGGTINANLGAGAATNSAGTTTLNGTLGTTNLVVSGGTINLGSANRLDNGLALTISGGTLGLGANSDTVGSFVISSGTLDGSGTLTASTYALDGGTVAGNLGAGTINVGGSAALNGTAAATAINVNSGTLTLGSGSRFIGTTPAVTMAGGTLALGGAETIGSLTGSSGTVALDGNTLTVGAGNATSTYSGGITGTGGGLTKTGNGVLTLAANSSYTGATTINAGTLVYNSTNTSTAVAVNSGGTLAGSGSVGATTINSGGTMNPGNSPGTQTYSSLVWEGAGNYNWQLLDANGAAGTGYDTFVSTGAFTINATSGSKFNINLWTLSGVGPDTNGSAINFSGTSDYTWTLGSFGSISGFAANAFSINTGATNGTSGFANLFSGTFSVSTNATQLLLVYTAPLVSSVYTWNTTDGLWSDGANWAGALAPSNTSSIVFAGASGGVSTNDSQVNDISGLTFSNTAGSYTINGSAFTNGVSGVVNNSASAQTVNNDITLGGAQIFNAAAGDLTFGGAVDNNGNLLNVTGAGNTALNGAVSGSGGLTKLGSGSLTLGGNNSFTGTLTANAGTVLVAGTQATTTINIGGGTLLLGADHVLTNGATLTLSNGTVNLGGFSDTISTYSQVAGTITNGSLAATTYNLSGGTMGAGLNGGAVTVGGNVSLSGTITNGASVSITNGTLTYGSANRIGDNSTVTLNGSGATINLGTFSDTISTYSQVAGTITNGSLAAATYSLTGGTMGAGLNGGAVTVGGNVSLSGTITNGASVSITNGTLTYAANDRIGDNSTVTVNGGTLNLATFSDTISTYNQVAGSITNGSLAATTYNLTAGTMGAGLNGGTVNVGGNVSLSGTITNGASVNITNGGTLTLGSANRISENSTVTVNGGLLNLGGFSDTISVYNQVAGVITNGTLVATTYNLDGGTVATNTTLGAGTANVTNGIVTLNGSLAATTLNIGGGTLGLGANGRIDNATVVNLSSGILDMGTFIDGVGTFNMTGGSVNGTGTLSAVGGLNLQAGTINANIGSSAVNISNGTTTINGTVGGAVTVSSGTANLNGALSSTLTASGGTANLNTNVAGNVTVSGGTMNLGAADLIGNASTVNMSSGALNLNGNDSVGAVTLTGGTIGGSGTLTGSSYAVQAGTISAGIGGSGAMTKTGAGTTTLSANNSGYSGAVAVNSGALLATTSGALGTGAVTMTNGSTLAGNGVSLANNFTIGTVASIIAGTNVFVAGWDFQSTNNGGTAAAGSPNSPTLYRANFGVQGSNAVIYLNGSDGSSSWASSQLDAFAGTSLNTTGGMSSVTSGAASLALVNSTANGQRVVFTLDMTGLATLDLSYASRFSGTTGFNSQVWEYSTDGSTWVGFYTNTSLTNSFAVYSNTSAITALSNSSTAYLRLTVSGASAAAGNNRLDNIQLNALSIGTSNAATGSGTLGIGEAGTATFSGNIVNNNQATLTAASGGTATFSGAISGAGSVNKTGAGTVTLSGASANTFAGTTTITQGVLELNKTAGVNAIASTNITVSKVDNNNRATLLLSANNQVANTTTVTLSGGTITRGSGVSEVFGNLNLTEASFLDFGTGAVGELQFGTYTSSALLTVNNFLPGNKLIFVGTDLSGSINNTSLFSFQGDFQSAWNSGNNTFTITAIPEPSTYLAAAGLLGLMLWPSRKRIVRDAKKILGLRAPMRDRLAARRA